MIGEGDSGPHPAIGQEEGFIALRRYYLWANGFRTLYLEAISEPHGPISNVYVELAAGTRFKYLSYWFAALEVVVEGWECLRLEDATIGRLIRDPDRRRLLKRYRNGVFHFQRRLDDERFAELLRDGTQMVAWALELHTALGQALFPSADPPAA